MIGECLNKTEMDPNMTRSSQNGAHKTTRKVQASHAKQYSRNAYPAGVNGSRKFDMGKSKKKRSPGKIVLLCVSVFIALAAVLVGIDFALNNGKIHYGVSIEGIDIGGMSKDAATVKLQSKIDSRLANSSVTLEPDGATQERLHNRAVTEGGEAVAVSSSEGSQAQTAQAAYSTPVVTSQAEDEEDGGVNTEFRWTFTASELGATFDASPLIDEAYTVGKVNDIMDFFPGLFERFKAYFGQADLRATVEYNEEVFNSTVKTLNDTVGVEMVNCGIAIDGEGNAAVQSGQNGERVDEEILKQKASRVLFGDTKDAVVIPTAVVTVAVDKPDAQAVADSINATIAQPVTLSYQENTWSIDRALLGSWIYAHVEGADESATLVASLDAAKAYDGMQAILGDVGYGSAQNATIDVSSGVPVIVGGEKGIGPDLKAATITLEDILFGSNATQRVVSLVTNEVEPAVTAQDVSAMGITELITTYKLSYGTNSGSNREYNIEHCLDTLNNSYVAPGANWNWNEIVGPCNISTGYKEASVIGADNEYTQAAGGGICNVATGVFNAAYEAGFPVVERSNHSLYQANYPLGRDAAVYWEFPTLVFSNDTDNYILMTASYDGSYMYISIWGTNQQRTVTSENSEWKTHEDGATSITNYRKVYNADGSLRYEDSFYSYFPATD